MASTKAWELRAAVSLARSWSGHGRRAEAVTTLGDVYGQFSEGLDALDLVEAKALLDSLA